MRRLVHITFFLIVMSMLITACRADLTAQPAAATPLPAVSPTTAPTATPEPTVATLPQGEIININNAAGLSKIAEIPTAAIYKLRWNREGNSFWLISDKDADLYDARTAAKVTSFSISGTGQILDASPDGKTLAVSGDMKTIDFWDAISRTKSLSITPSAGFGSVEFSPDGEKFLTSAMDAWEVTLWNPTNGSILDTLSGFETAAPMYQVKFGLDGESILWVARGTLQAMDIASKTLTTAIQHEDFINDALVTSDRQYIISAAAGMINGNFTPLVKVSSWQNKTVNTVAQIAVEEPITALAAHPQNLIGAAAYGGRIGFWKEKENKISAALDCGVPNITAMAFAPNARLLLVGTDAGVQLWAANPK